MEEKTTKNDELMETTRQKIDSAIKLNVEDALDTAGKTHLSYEEEQDSYSFLAKLFGCDSDISCILDSTRQLANSFFEMGILYFAKKLTEDK